MTPENNLELQSTAVRALLQLQTAVLGNAANWAVPILKKKIKKLKVILPVGFFPRQWIKAIMVINFYGRLVPDLMFGLYFIL